MTVKIRSVENLGEVKTLLQISELPVDDLVPGPERAFFGAYEANVLAAVIGLEIYASVALLRSLAVTPALRRQGVGRAWDGRLSRSLSATQPKRELGAFVC